MTAFSTPTVAEWAAYRARREGQPATSAGASSWTFGETEWGYEGVQLERGRIVYYSHRHNRHAGGGATTQSYQRFLEDGPKVGVPDAVLDALYDEVSARRRKP